ncbi:MAG: ATP-grasp domain-containing protein, partial [Gemmatimonadales bacterium]
MRIAILAARTGWHTDELARAAAERKHEAIVLPYEGLVASIGPAPGLRSRSTELDGVDAVLARIIPSGSLEQTLFR